VKPNINAVKQQTVGSAWNEIETLRYVGNNSSTSTSTKAILYKSTSVRRAAAASEAASEGCTLQKQRHRRHWPSTARRRRLSDILTPLPLF